MRSLPPGSFARAGRTSVVVGTVLTAINQGGQLVAGLVTPGMLLRIGLTYVVPFLVALHAMRDVVLRQGRAGAEAG